MTKTITNTTVAKQKGRPVNANSVRQQTLALKAELRAQGLVKRGRPVVAESKRQAEMARKDEMRQLGLLNGMKGRPVNVSSKRQQELARKAELRAAGLLKPGRPKTKTDDLVDLQMVKESAE
jgi:hypothetical protein